MATRPAVLPEPFKGTGGEYGWEDWLAHFNDMAAVNGRDEAAKLKWLKVRLTGPAQRAFQRIPDDKKADFDTAVKLLEERFEPESKHALYAVEFEAFQKKPTEGWAETAEQLKRLTDKAYKGLADDTKELLALNRFLKLLNHPQVGYSVRQRKPKTLNEAVTATLECESYWKLQEPPTIPTAPTQTVALEEEPIGTVQASNDVAKALKELTEKVELLETKLKTSHPPRTNQQPRRRNMVCWNCKKEGHIARFCRTSRKGEGTQQTAPFNSVSVSSTYFVQGMIQGHSAQLVGDTGAAFSLISHNF